MSRDNDFVVAHAILCQYTVLTGMPLGVWYDVGYLEEW